MHTSMHSLTIIVRLKNIVKLLGFRYFSMILEYLYACGQVLCFGRNMTDFYCFWSTFNYVLISGWSYPPFRSTGFIESIFRYICFVVDLFYTSPFFYNFPHKRRQNKSNSLGLIIIGWKSIPGPRLSRWRLLSSTELFEKLHLSTHIFTLSGY